MLNKPEGINTSLNKSQAWHKDGATDKKKNANGTCQNLSPIKLLVYKLVI